MSLTSQKAAFEARFPTATVHQVILLDYTDGNAVTVASGDMSTVNDTIDFTGFTPAPVVGTRVIASSMGDQTDFSNSQVYYVVNVAGSLVKLSATPGGTEVDITVATSGTFTELAPVYNGGSGAGAYTSKTETIADAVRWEVASYGNINSGNRPTWTPPANAAFVYSAIDNEGTTVQATSAAPVGVGFAAADSTVDLDTSTAVTWNYFVVIYGGSTTPGNTSGTIREQLVSGDGTEQTATVGSTLQIPITDPVVS